MISRDTFYGGSRHLKTGARVGSEEQFDVALDVRVTDCQATRSPAFQPTAILRGLSSIRMPRLGFRILVTYHPDSANTNANLNVEDINNSAIATVSKGSAALLVLVDNSTEAGTWRVMSTSFVAGESP